MELFRRLLNILFPPRKNELLIQKLAEDGLLPHLDPQPIMLDALPVTTLLPYRTPAVQAAIVEAKYHANEMAQTLLSDILAEYVLELSSEEAALGGTMVLIPIPLSRERLTERGYNQTEHICRKALRRVPGINVDSALLARTRDTVPQTTLARAARLRNMKDAFQARQALRFATYVLVDDVATTGATLNAAAAALKNAGAHHIIAIALAH